MTPSAEYRRVVVAKLDAFAEAASRGLSRFLSRRPPKAARGLALEVQFYPLSQPLPVVGYWLDEQGDQLGEAVAPLRRRLMGRAEERRHLEAGVDILEIHAPLVERWFAARFRKAGGAAFPLPVTLALHDGAVRRLARGTRRPAR